jgi:hypothetical protein
LNAGPYSIAVASTIRTALPAANTQLQDYVLPSAKTAGLREMVEADDEVVEGASRVSLRCPVSHQRLVTPVKAATCRHLQVLLIFFPFIAYTYLCVLCISVLSM